MLKDNTTGKFQEYQTRFKSTTAHLKDYLDNMPKVIKKRYGSIHNEEFLQDLMDILTEQMVQRKPCDWITYGTKKLKYVYLETIKRYQKDLDNELAELEVRNSITDFDPESSLLLKERITELEYELKDKQLTIDQIVQGNLNKKDQKIKERALKAVKTEDLF